MRYRELAEAPIDQYAGLGDWEDASGSFNSSNRNEVSKNIINNPKAVSKVRDIWQKVPQTFNFYFINAKIELDHFFGDISEFSKKKTFAPFLDQMKLSPNAINVIYTTNFTSQANYIPMTAWIMAHRLWHVFQFEDNVAPPVKHNVDLLLSDAFAKTTSAYTGDAPVLGQNFFMMSSIPWPNCEFNPELVTKLFTMRSARMNKLQNELDIPAELFAQHLISGKISFNELPQQLTVRGEQYNLPGPNNIWGQLTTDLTGEFNQLLNACIGKVLVL